MWVCWAGTVEWLWFFYLIWIKDKLLETTRSSFGLPQKVSVCFTRSRIFKTTGDTSEREDRSPANTTEHHLVSGHFCQTDIWLIFISCGGCKLPWAHAAPKHQQTTGRIHIFRGLRCKISRMTCSQKKKSGQGFREDAESINSLTNPLRCICGAGVMATARQTSCSDSPRDSVTSSRGVTWQTACNLSRTEQKPEHALAGQHQLIRWLDYVTIRKSCSMHESGRVLDVLWTREKI